MAHLQASSTDKTTLRQALLKQLLSMVVVTLDADMQEEWKILNEAHRQLHLLTAKILVREYAIKENIELDQMDEEFLEVYLAATPEKQAAMLDLVKEAAEKYKRH
jgi:hypothetical protein